MINLLGSPQENPYYAGIGSRKTPYNVLCLMGLLSNALEKRGFILRSGGADGADTAFENGVTDPKMKQIFLPWKGFNGREDGIIFQGELMNRAMKLASEHHPVWGYLKLGGRYLHARNMGQVLGPDLNTPSAFILAYTTDGKASGGTGQAIRVGQAYNIPILNLYHQNVRQLLIKELLIKEEQKNARAYQEGFVQPSDTSF